MIGVAILGAGIGREHLAAYQELPDRFDVRLIVDRDLDRARAIAGDIRCAADVAAAVYDRSVDLVDICLPPNLHVPTAVSALGYGKHVICEKPLATSLADCDRLAAAADKKGSRIFPVFQYRYGPGLAKLRALIAAGLAGTPHAAAVETHWARGADYYDQSWRGTWAGEQGGAILCHAIHAHDLLCQIMGPVARVSAMLGTRINPIETEDCAAISLQMQNGALCTSSVTLGAARDETRLRFVFAGLTATSGPAPYAPGRDDWTFEARDPACQAELDACLAAVPEEPLGFPGFLAAVADALDGHADRAVSFDDGVGSVALVSALYASARRGTWVDLPITPTDPLYEGWQP